MKWVLVEASDRILPGGRRGDGEVRAARTARRATSTSGWRPGWSPARTASPCSATAPGCRPGPGVDGRRQAAPRPRRHRPAARPTAAGYVHRDAAGGRDRRTSGRPATPPPYPTSPRREPGTRTAPPTPSTPSARRGCSPTTSSRTLRGDPLNEYRHAYAGSVASLGLHKGVAHVYGRKLKGYPRLVHAPRLPPEPRAHLQPQGARARRMDPRRALQARDRLARVTGAPARRVRTRPRTPAGTRRRADPWRRGAPGRNPAPRDGV